MSLLSVGFWTVENSLKGSVGLCTHGIVIIYAICRAESALNSQTSQRIFVFFSVDDINFYQNVHIQKFIVCKMNIYSRFGEGDGGLIENQS